MTSHPAHVLVIGAGPYQMPAIRLARQRGYCVTATDARPDAMGGGIANELAVVSTRDVAATRSFAMELHRRHPLDGVMTMASESAVTVATVAEALNLPGLDVEAARVATHKGLRQERFHEAGIPSPRFVRVTGVLAAEHACREIGFPVVVKPVDSAGSRGVRKIAAIDELAPAVEEIASISTTDEFVVEEFLTGSEHSIEGVVLRDGVRWTGFSDRNYSRKEEILPHFLEDGDTLPTILPPQTVAQIHDVATAAVEALGITWGPVKGDILVDASGPRVIEMAARLSGDYFCDETVPLHNGIELVPIVMDLSLGTEVQSSTLEPRYNRGVALRGIWPTGRRLLGIERLDEARNLPGVRFVRLDPKWATANFPAETSPRDRLAAVLACGETRAEAVERAERAVAAVQVLSRL